MKFILRLSWTLHRMLRVLQLNPSNLVRVLEGATKPIFALLTSAMHMAWLRHIGGRLKSD